MNSNGQRYHIVKFSSNNLADVEQLHKAVYGKALAAGYLAAKYNTAYTHVKYVGYLAYATDNLPIAFYGVIPCYVKCGNEIILAAQSADTMTHPQYRYKGLFVELAELTFRLCRETGISLLFGFPNQNSAHGLINKLNWRTTETLQCFKIPVKTIPLQKLAGKHAVLKKAYQVYTSRVLQKYRLPDQETGSSVFADGYGGVLRSADYMQYKTYSKTWRIGIGQSEIWFKLNNGLTIGDVMLSEPDAGELIENLKHLAVKLGTDRVVFQVSPCSNLYRLLKRDYKPLPTFPVIFLDLGCKVPPDLIKFTFADIDIF